MNERRKALGALVRRERVRQEMKSQPALAKRAGISPRKVSDVERGEFAGSKTYDAIEMALSWGAGSMQAYLNGGPEPQSAPHPEMAAPPHEWSATERQRMRDMPWTEVRETYEMFMLKSEYVAQVWMREVMRVKSEAESSTQATTDSHPLSK